MQYRREIDGLRAVAVIPVILFHAGFTIFSGGYVGVDIFFVISGYLITSIIISELEQGKFSILRFYERRARRILPALFFVMLSCIPFAWMWMLPAQFKDFSQSLVAVTVFASNILFWRESGYFAAASEEKPLLHTWSLAVEEQYYMLFPIFLILLWRFGRSPVFYSIIVISIISLLLSEWGWRNKPTANFYLAPTRAWELLAGSICAFLQYGKMQKSNNALSAFGLALILFAIFVYDKSTPFPSAYALAPVLGTALIIMYGARETWVARLLSLKGFVGIGLISYSAYLWHQPLFAFARIRSIYMPEQWLMLLLAVASLVLAYFSWRYVEQPFRIKGRFSRTRVFQFSALATMLMLSLGFIGHAENGFADSGYQQPILTVKPLLHRNVIVLGDSHGGHLIFGLEQITSGKVTNLTSSGCIPFRNVDRYDFRSEKGACAAVVNNYLDEIIEADPNASIVLSSMGPVYLQGTSFKGKDRARVTGLGVELISDKSITDRWAVYEIGMRNTLMELSALKNSKILFAIDVPELGIDEGCQQESKRIITPLFELKDFVVKPQISDCYVSVSDYDQRSVEYKKLVYDVIKDFPNIALFDPTDAFCDDIRCKGFSERFGYLYKDVDHLSENGSVFFAIQLAKALIDG